MKKGDKKNGKLIQRLSAHLCHSQEAHLPPAVVQKAKHHILDTFAAMISGSKLKPGELARNFIRGQGGAKEAQVVGCRTLTTAIQAALANGMMAHADETDDAHPRSQTHPGCAAVPAALAMSEREGADGMTFLKAVVAGYDVGCRVTQALDVESLRQKSFPRTAWAALLGPRLRLPR